MDEVEVVLRQGTSAEWTASGLILGQGEMGYDTTTDVLKVGDGTALFAALPTMNAGGAGGAGFDVDADYTLTGAWSFEPPALGTIDEDGNSDAGLETTAITVKPQAIGTPAFNVVKWDGSPQPLDSSGYGVIHLDSDGGVGFAGERFTVSESCIVIIDGPTGNNVLQVRVEGFDVFVAGGFLDSLVASSPTPEVGGLALYATNDQTADMLRVYKPEIDAYTFRVTAEGEVYAPGGVVLTSPNDTKYRLVVDNAGVLSTEAV